MSVGTGNCIGSWRRRRICRSVGDLGTWGGTYLCVLGAGAKCARRVISLEGVESAREGVINKGLVARGKPLIWDVWMAEVVAEWWGKCEGLGGDAPYCTAPDGDVAGYWLFP